MEHAADLLLISQYDPELGEVAAFEELIGSHGGLGGAQTKPFILHPADWTLDEELPIGAPAIYRNIRRWLESIGIQLGGIGAMAPSRRSSQLEQWDEIKAAVSEAIVSAGGSITHHHAVGRDHRPWYELQRPDSFAGALAAAKRSVDPDGLLNPGVLIDPEVDRGEPGGAL